MELLKCAGHATFERPLTTWIDLISLCCSFNEVHHYDSVVNSNITGIDLYVAVAAHRHYLQFLLRRSLHEGKLIHIF